MENKEIEAKIEEVKSSGKPLEEWVDDLIIWEQSRGSNPLHVIYILRVAFGIKSLAICKGLTEMRCYEMKNGDGRNPKRVKEFYEEEKIRWENYDAKRIS